MNTVSISESTRVWVGVASREHVQNGIAGGFAQFCHGKRGPASRPRRGDFVLYYSGQERLGETTPCQKFTALGVIEDDGPITVEQFPGFFPWRRSVRWLHETEASIRPLIGRLSFIGNKQSWGAKFRFGFLEIRQDDLRLLAREMGVKLMQRRECRSGALSVIFLPMPDTPDSDWTKLLDDSFSILKPLKPGEWTQARVLSISKDTVFLELDGKNEGQLAREEVTDKDGDLTVSVGDTVKAFLLKTDGGERIFTTRISGETAGADLLEQAFREDVPVDGLVEREIKGGYEIKVGEFRAFCPYSQMGDRRAETPGEYIGKRLRFRIQEFKDDGRRIVVSNRVFFEEARQETLIQLKATLKEGQTVRGTVKSVHDYGAFVDLGGVQALLPVSEYDRARVDDLRAVLSPGQELEARILKLDWTNDKLTLSRKSLQADPWAEASARFPEGTKLSGKVARVTTFGAFVTLAPGIDGLVHVSEFRSDGKYAGGNEVPVKVGQTLAVQVLSVDAANRRIALKPATSREEDETAAKYSSGSTGDTYNPFAALLKKK